MPPLNGHFPHQAVVRVQLFFGLALDLSVFPQSVLGIRKGGFQFQSRAAGLGGMSLVHDNRKVPSRHLIHFLIDDRELLQGGDDNAHTAVDGIPQVLGGFLFPDGLNGTERVVKAGDRLLQLCIQHGAVGNDDHAGEHRLVLLIEQRGQPVSRPRNGIGLAASGAVLDQVIMPRSVLPDIGQQLAHHIQLMIARKNQRFAVLQVHKLLDNVHHTVLLKDILPQIRCRVTVWVCRIALAAVVSGSVGALVKGQEIGVLSGELCGHPHLGVIHAEIGQNTLVELEAKLPRVAVIHPLPLGIIHRLAGALVFQFKGEHRDAVEHQHHIHTLFCIGGEVPLAIALDGVCRPLGSRRLIQGRLRLKIAHPKTQSTVLEAVAQDREQSLRLASRVERCAELPHRIHLIGVFKSRPLLGLGALNEVDQGVHI